MSTKSRTVAADQPAKAPRSGSGGTIQFPSGELAKALFAAASEVPFATISTSIGGLDSAAQGGLLTELETLLRSRKALAQEPVRVCIAKLLIALLPRSEAQLGKLLRRRGAGAEDLHFSLFSLLEEAVSAAACPVTFDWGTLVEQYLMHSVLTEGHAALAAGELLGEYGDVDSACRALIATVTTAPRMLGRLGAVHGLGVLLGRRQPGQQDVVDTLRVVARRDGSKRVRQYAQSVVTGRPSRTKRSHSGSGTKKP